MTARYTMRRDATSPEVEFNDLPAKLAELEGQGICADECWIADTQECDYDPDMGAMLLTKPDAILVAEQTDRVLSRREAVAAALRALGIVRE